MDYKKLLIISHNCLSKTGSNGRTLANYLDGWPKEKIAQIYIHPENPSSDVCNQYYCLSDRSIISSIIQRKPAGYIVYLNENTDSEKDMTHDKGKKKAKNSILFLARELAWKTKLWNSKNLKKWLKDFGPEVILVQAGDAAFLLDMSVEMAKIYDADLVVYNTEGYFFKKKSHLPENWLSQYFYPTLNRRFRNTYNKMIIEAKREIYNCDLLKNDYEKVFHTESRVIMNTSEFTEEDVFNPKKSQIIYAGNLGLDRHKSLIQFANALHQVTPDMVVDVYGKTPNDSVKTEMEKCIGIRMHGFIPYEELKQKLRESKYLLHVESFDSFYREDLKYAFSTKIADSLAAGACLFVYAPDNMAVVQYLKGKKSAALITDPSMLTREIRRILTDEESSRVYAKNGRLLAEQNHNIKKNREAFQAILLEEGEIR